MRRRSLPLPSSVPPAANAAASGLVATPNPAGKGSMIATGGWVCLLAPLAGALAIVLAGTRITRRHAGWIATLSVFVAFAGALASLVDLLGHDPEERTHLSTAYTWLQVAGFQADMSILVDPLSVTMMLVVSGVGGLIVWYSMGYMAGADEERRYFAYMALFVFSMLLLVEAGNLLILLVGWGLVGLASYLLIGFDHHRPAAIAAAKKAFVMNAVGDATMALAFFLLISRLGTLDFAPVFEAAEEGLRLRHRPDARRARVAGGGGGQVGAGADPHVAPGRDGRADARLRAHPRGDDGHRGRLPDLSHTPDVRGRSDVQAPGRSARARDAAARWSRRARAAGHQAGDRLLDHVADRLHVRRGRRRRVRVCDVPPRHARVLQGAAVPLRRPGHPPPGRRAGHPAAWAACGASCRGRTSPS